MTKPFHLKNESRRLLCIAIATGLSACSAPTTPLDKEKTMINPSMTLWKVIKELEQQIPFSKEKIEQTLSTVLVRRDVSGNHFFFFYRSDPVQLQNGGLISHVDLRIKRESKHPGFLVLNISGECVPLQQVRMHYNQTRITDHPRGRSLDEVTSHTATLPWGELSFSFKERQPDCLSSVAFEPTKFD
jgi:hypothetical protein